MPIQDLELISTVIAVGQNAKDELLRGRTGRLFGLNMDWICKGGNVAFAYTVPSYFLDLYPVWEVGRKKGVKGRIDPAKQVGLPSPKPRVGLDGSRVYTANSNDDTVSVINKTTNTVVASVPVGNNPLAFGKFVGPCT